MSEEAVHDLIVVGGGISGLGFAHLAAKQGLYPLVLEATEHVGGCIDSHHFQTPEGEYWAELGAHTCFNSYGTLLSILRDLGKSGGFQAKDKLHYRILTSSGLTSIPRALSFMRLLGSVHKIFSLDKTQCSVEEYFGAIVGHKNFEEVVGPALDAVICQPSASVPAASLFRKKARDKSVERSFTSTTGLQDFVDLIAGQSGMEVHTECSVSDLTREGEQFRVLLQSGDEHLCNNLVLAVAPDVASGLLKPIYPELSSLMGEIAMAEIETLSLLTAANTIQLPPVAGIIAQDDEFYSAVSRDPVSDPKYRAFTFHFRPDRLDGAAQLARACDVLGISRDQVVAYQSKRNRLPALRMGHAKRVRRIDELLSSLPIAVTGNWFDGVSIEDSLLRSDSEFNRLYPG